MSYRFGLIFLLAVCWAAVSVEAKIYYVAVDGSDLIDKGMDVGLPYHGRGPDLGADEYCQQVCKPVKQIYSRSRGQTIDPTE